MERIRAALIAALTGVLLIGTAWAGAGLAPVKVEVDAPAIEAPTTAVAGASGLGLQSLGEGEFLVGAAKVNIAPQPGDGDVWEKDPAKCLPSGTDSLEYVTDLRSPWIEDSNCIYTGGYGLGPTHFVTDFDEQYGLWSRTVAISNDEDTVVLTILDGSYYFGAYDALCDGCGFFDLAQSLGAELGIPAENFVFASTHAHTAPDFIGGWGAVPGWYMDQVADAMRASVRQAVGAEGCPSAETCVSPAAAVLEAGEVLAREHNSERRDTYRSAEDPTVNWLRAVDADTGDGIATIGNFGAHPTTVNHRAATIDGQPNPLFRVAHADWPGLFEAAVEEEFGGIGLLFMAGLGNMSARGGVLMGEQIAGLIPDVGEGRQITDTRIAAAQEFWDQPITNVPLGALGGGGFFDRSFTPLPATIEVSQDFREDRAMCRSASAVSVRTAVSALRIGDMFITGFPGEIFANMSNTITERLGNASMSIALANDGLGYIMQSFETNHASRQGLGFVISDQVGYEDAYGIDACFGDYALETALGLASGL